MGFPDVFLRRYEADTGKTGVSRAAIVAGHPLPWRLRGRIVTARNDF
jgi:hypothetical protein